MVAAIAAAFFAILRRIQPLQLVSASVRPSARPPIVASWRQHLPPAPELPRSLWLTGGALLLAMLSYGFRAEVWPNYPAAGRWSLALLPLLLLAGLLQVLSCLQHWIAAVTRPGWLRPILRAGMLVVQVGTALLIVAVVAGGLLALALLS